MSPRKDHKNLIAHSKSPEDFLKNPMETDEIDYKLERGLSKKDEASFVKDASAMANGKGGLLIYGMEPKQQSFPGIEPKDYPAYYDSSKLNDLLKKYLSPVPSISSAMVPYEEKIFCFVYIAENIDQPSIVCNNLHDEKPKTPLLLRAGDIYVRQNTQTILIQNAHQSIVLIEKYIQNGIRKRLVELKPILDFFSDGKSNQPSPSKFQDLVTAALHLEPTVPFREFSLIPLDKEKSVDQDRRMKAFQTCVSYNGFYFPHFNHWNDSGSSMMQDGILRSYVSENNIFRTAARQLTNGSFKWTGSLWEDEPSEFKQKFPMALGHTITLSFIAFATKFIESYLTELGLENEWDFEYRICNISGYSIQQEDVMRYFLPNKKTALESNAVFKKQISLKLLKENSLEFSCQVAQEIFRQFNYFPSDEMVKNDLKKVLEESRLELLRQN